MAVPAPRTPRPSLPSSLLQPFTKQAYGPPPSRSQGAAGASASGAPPVAHGDRSSLSAASGPSASGFSPSPDPGPGQAPSSRERHRTRSRRVVGWVRSKLSPASQDGHEVPPPAERLSSPSTERLAFPPPGREIPSPSRDSKPLPHLPSAGDDPPRLSLHVPSQTEPERGDAAPAPPDLGAGSILAQLRAERARQAEWEREKGRRFEQERLAARREARKFNPPATDVADDAFGATSYLKRYEGSPKSRGLQLMAQQDRMRGRAGLTGGSGP